MTVSELKQQRCLYEGQQLLFLGTAKTTVKNIYVRGMRVRSAIFSNETKPIFRSESARFLLAIQMSKEMWDFDNEASGEITWTKAIAFFQQLFERWSILNARHLLTVVFFTRLEYTSVEKFEPLKTDDRSESERSDSSDEGQGTEEPEFKDFYRVVACEASQFGWPSILQQLKEEFHCFARDVETQPSGRKGGLRVAGRPSTARRGNMLEAINLAASQSLHDEDDPDFIRNGTHILLLTPRPAIFDVDESLLKVTTERLVNSGIGVDIVCLAQLPLHSVPLFCLFRHPSTPEQVKPGADARSGRRSRDGISALSAVPTTTRSDFGFAVQRPNDADAAVAYVIPSWVEVSFFDGQRPAEKEILVLRERRSKFVQRCKMYEVQMMGLSNSAKRVALPNVSAGLMTRQTTKFGSDKDSSNSLGSNPDIAQWSASVTDKPSMNVLTKSSEAIRQDTNESDSDLDLRWTEKFDTDVFQVDDRSRDMHRELPNSALKGTAIKSVPKSVASSHPRSIGDSSALSTPANFRSSSSDDRTPEHPQIDTNKIIVKRNKTSRTSSLGSLYWTRQSKCNNKLDL